MNSTAFICRLERLAEMKANAFLSGFLPCYCIDQIKYSPKKKIGHKRGTNYMLNSKSQIPAHTTMTMFGCCLLFNQFNMIICLLIFYYFDISNRRIIVIAYAHETQHTDKIVFFNFHLSFENQSIFNQSN